ncbi:MAG: hypothetical protein WD929_01920 [Steroidobacteraceae bacterium]
MEQITVPATPRRRPPGRVCKTSAIDIDRIEDIKIRLGLVREWIVLMAESDTVGDEAASGAVNHLLDARDLLLELIHERELQPA